MQIDVELDIQKPKELVWSVITDIENAKNVIVGIKALEIIEKPSKGIVGLKWMETREMFGKESSETMWITEAEENHYYATRAESHGSVYITKLTLKVKGDISNLSMSFTGEGQSFLMKVLSSVMGFFIKKSMKKMMYKDLEDIKHYVESLR